MLHAPNAIALACTTHYFCAGGRSGWLLFYAIWFQL